MTHDTSTILADLRRRAEWNLSRLVKQSVPSLSPENVEALVHELQVHQIELDMQCEELRRVNHELEESRDRYRELYESIPIGYATIDATGRMYDMNPAGAQLLGLHGTKAVLNNNFFFFFSSEEEADAITLLVRKIIAEQKPDSCERNMKRFDGHSFRALLQVVPVQAGEGKGERLRIAFKDITQDKQTEGALRNYQKELEDNRAELQNLAGKLFSAQEEERRRIACELHDDYCQRVTAVILEVSSLSKRCRAADSSLLPLLPRIEAIREKLGEILESFRYLSHELHPRNLDTLSLASSLRSLIREVSSHSGMRIEFQEETVPDHLPMSTVICLYRLLQESLNNVRKHANASSVAVRLIGTPHEVKLWIRDDGVGFETGRTAEGMKGIGLTSMQERIRPLGGHVSIESHSGQGTIVTAVIPLSRTATPLPSS